MAFKEKDPQSVPHQNGFVSRMEAADPPPISGMSSVLLDSLFAAGHFVAGEMAILGSVVYSLEALAPTGENPFGNLALALNTTGVVFCLAADTLVPKDALSDSEIGYVSLGCTALITTIPIVFSRDFMVKCLETLGPDGARQLGARVNSACCLVAMGFTCWHFFELAEIVWDAARTKTSLLDEARADLMCATLGGTSNVATYTALTLYDVAVHDEDMESRAGWVFLKTGANLLVAGLEWGETIAPFVGTKVGK